MFVWVPSIGSGGLVHIRAHLGQQRMVNQKKGESNLDVFGNSGQTGNQIGQSLGYVVGVDS
jgi:hypothetical protein